MRVQFCKKISVFRVQMFDLVIRNTIYVFYWYKLYLKYHKKTFFGVLLVAPRKTI